VTDTAPATLGLRSLFPYLRQHRTALVAVALISLVGAAAALVQPLLVGRVITTVQDGGPLTPVVTLLIAVLLGGSLVGGLQQYLLQRTAEGVVLTTRLRLVDRLLRLPIVEYDRRRTGDLMSRVGSDTTLLRAVVTSGLIEVVSSVLVVVGAVVAMALVDGVLLSVTLAAVAVGMAAGISVARQLRRLALASQERVGQMSAAVERSLSAVRTIRASGATEREIAGVDASARGAYDAGIRAARVEAAISPIVGIAVQGAFVAVLGVGGYRVASGAITVAQLVSFILYLFLLVMPLGQLVQSFAQLQLGLGALTRIEEILVLPEEDQVDGSGARSSTDAAPARLASSAPPPMLELDRVGFHYADGTPVLHDVSFRVARGTRTALVGPSGAGKSTLLSLVERFYDVSSGSLRLDGVDVRDLPRAALRSRLGYVEQETPVLAGSLRDNLLLAAPDTPDAELHEVLAAVGLTSLTTRSPDGLDAPVGEDGVLLSGGERQRLAISRSLLARPELLLLDEPTASLDARNERALSEALDAIADRTTMLVVAHRLSTVVSAEQIVVLDGGRVVGVGTHTELLESSSLYRDLAATQLLV
jgi:ABC-type multidrug transport system fused ATPase/permease subunit